MAPKANTESTVATSEKPEAASRLRARKPATATATATTNRPGPSTEVSHPRNNPENDVPGGNLSDDPLPAINPISTTIPVPPESITAVSNPVPSKNNGNVESNGSSEMLSAFRDLLKEHMEATSNLFARAQSEQAENARSIQQEMNELRSLMKENPSRASSRQSTGSGGETIIARHASRRRSTLESDIDAPGLQTVTESEDDNEGWHDTRSTPDVPGMSRKAAGKTRMRESTPPDMFMGTDTGTVNQTGSVIAPTRGLYGAGVPTYHAGRERQTNRQSAQTNGTTLTDQMRDTPPHLRTTSQGGEPNSRGRSRTPRRDRSRSPDGRRQRGDRRRSESRSPRRSVSGTLRQRTPFEFTQPARIQPRSENISLRELTGREYSQRLWKYYEDMITHQVLMDVDYPKDFRGTRDPGPDPYEGSPDIDEFESWLVQLLEYFQMNKLCGPAADWLRIIKAGHHLGGQAQKWYASSVYTHQRNPGVVWTFLEVVKRLFKTFIDETALQTAVRSYQLVEYSEGDGVLEYLRVLEQKASRLTSNPDDYSFRERFIEGLPKRLVQKLINKYDITTEGSNIEEMVDAIRKVEKTTAYSKRFSERSKAHHSSSRSPARKEHRRDKSHKRDSHKKSGSSGDRVKHDKSRDGEDKKRSNRDDVRKDQKPETSKDRTRDAGGAKGSNAHITCFACQEKGHYANDPSCPMYGKQSKPALRDRPQVRAARAEPGDYSSEDEYTSYDGDGSQYSASSEGESSSQGSETGESAADSPSAGSEEGTPDDSGDSDPMRMEDQEDGDDLKYVRAVRAKATQDVGRENPSRASLNRKMERPRRTKRQETCLAGWIRVNGVDAFTLFDSGSNTDTLSPSFARVANGSTHQLEQQVPLQLGTVGSRAAINYGVKAPVELGKSRCKDYYFDIVNIDRYDCIAGAPMMRKFGVRLDFREDAIFVEDQRIQALLPDEEAAILRGREPHKSRAH